MMDTQKGEVRLNHVHHVGNGCLAEQDEPFVFRCRHILVAI